MTPEAFAQMMTLMTVVGTGVGTVLLQVYREGRARKWAEADRQMHAAEDMAHREMIAAKVKTEADMLAVHVKAEADLLAVRLENERQRLALQLAQESLLSAASRQDLKRALSEASAKVDQTIERANAAYKEANHVNLKIEDLNARLLKQQNVAEAGTTEARTIGEATLKGVERGNLTGDATLEVVRQINTTVHPPAAPEEKT
jgi:hypothetical protein